MESAIETRGLTKVYSGGVRALEPLDLVVPRGTCFGLLGPNGAGKSTLVKTLLGIVHASGGEARILGRDFRQPSARVGVGYLPEGHAFPPYLSGRQVCRYFAGLSGQRGPELERDIAEKLEWVGMAERADERITKYSKGMKQRIGLAQALVGKPELVFLDEPTDGLDPVGRSEIRDVIRKVIAGGATVFFNSHLLSEVEQLCDDLAVLSRGRLLHEGKTTDLVAQMSGTGGEGISLAVGCGELPAELWGELSERGATRSEAGFRIRLAGREDITPLIDQLRAAGVELYALTPEELGLEDAFVRLIRGESQQGGEQGGEPAPAEPKEPA